MSTVETLNVNQEHVTLDLLLWRRFSNESRFRVETTLEANRSLAGLGPFLPVGTNVDIAVTAEEDAAPYVEIVRLWN